MQRVNLAGTWKFYYANIVRVLQTHCAGKVGCRESTVVTTKGYYFRFKFCHILFTVKKGSPKANPKFVISNS
jgi:hypothetical protein